MPFVAFALLASLACSPAARGDRAWRAGRAEEAAAAWSAGLADLDDLHRGRLARVLADLGRREEAEAVLEALPDARRGADAWLAAGLVAVQRGDPAAAAEAFARGLAVQDLPELRVNRCVAAVLAGAPEALDRCGEALEAAPEDPRAALAMAQGAWAQGLLPAAHRALDRAEALLSGADDPAIARWGLELARRMGDASRACRLAVRDGVADRRAGRDCLVAGRSREARRILAPLAEAGDRDAAVLLFRLQVGQAARRPAGPERVRALARASRWERAVAALGVPDEAGWWTDVGRHRWLAGDRAAAVEAWRRAMALAPAEAAPRLNLARAAREQGREEEARRLLEGGMDLPGDGGLADRLLLAAWELDDGRLEGAARALGGLEDACRSPRCRAEAAWLRSRLAARRGRAAEAMAGLEAAVAAGGAGFAARAAREADFALLHPDRAFRLLLERSGVRDLPATPGGGGPAPVGLATSGEGP